ncbi:HFL284Wp [Eremothecium sinecaudum]|uniref:Inosine triphosphate pyrophosphatase n=1 Tax=Eremothecium sinecaudum TaxID=45286 RepID=A0A109UZM9_9SACH|nr:HFL284Wp [Eremothecium sinecaudum]AMD21572.1 HFL284Wp [Eremothecium sinecaudum]
MTSKKEIIFVTGNKNKLREVQQLLYSENAQYTLANEPLDLIEVQELDLEHIALAKCKQAVSILGPTTPLFVEDTALSFTALNGLPGAYIKWFLQSIGLDGILRMLSAFEDKTAQAITTIAYHDGNGKYHIFQGTTEGRIVPSRGPTDFGWDSIFEPKDINKTYAEMDKPSKHAVSHRGKAFAKFKRFLNEPTITN